MKKRISGSALLEIGVEELPARFIAPALDQLKHAAETSLKEAGLPFEVVETWGAPRRLSLFIKGLPPKAADQEQMVIGPPPKAQEATQGFARAQKVPVEKLQLRQTPKGERYVVIRLVKGQKTEVLLKSVFPTLISKLNFPKSMVWESTRFRFARPIRWIVALYNTAVIRFGLAGVRSDRTTTGLLSLGTPKISIPRPERYKSNLQSRCVLVDPKDRQKKIVTQLEAAAKKAKAKPVLQPGHLDEVVNLTEYPTSLVGRFPEAYLSLPKEVLVSVLRKHQKFFPLENTKGQLISAFVGFRNGPSESQDLVRSGYERVVNARLADAQFFFDQDKKVNLQAFASRLNEIGFHEKLGSMADKTKRLESLTESYGRRLGLDRGCVQRAQQGARLCKADLLTQMVGEFPELQGVAGRFYANHQQLDAAVAQTLEQHYWPLTSDSPLPESDEACLLALADKVDTLVANFSVGLIPTGSTDPYGLRRAANGVVRILIQQKWNVPLNALLQEAGVLVSASSESLRKLQEFIVNRADTYFKDLGFRSDEIEALRPKMMNGEGFPVVNQKLSGLKAVRERAEFGSLSMALKRARNLLQQAQDKGFPVTLDGLESDQLQEEVERTLLQAIRGVHGSYQEALNKKQFEKALVTLATLKGPVDAFFEGVMVMVDDPPVREKRLQLLAQIKTLFDAFADFSKLNATS